MARLTGLEPATPGVTGRYSNQLSYNRANHVPQIAGIKLCKRLGAEVIGCAFVIDLPELGGRKLLEGLGYEVHALTEFDGA